MSFVLDRRLVQRGGLVVAFEIRTVQLIASFVTLRAVVDHRVVGRVRLPGVDVPLSISARLAPEPGRLMLDHDDELRRSVSADHRVSRDAVPFQNLGERTSQLLVGLDHPGGIEALRLTHGLIAT